jgi:hypothetical protein
MTAQPTAHFDVLIAGAECPASDHRFDVGQPEPLVKV